MDIRNLTTSNHFSPYNASAYSPTAGNGTEGAPPAPAPQPLRFPSAGDSFISMSSDGYPVSRPKRVVSPEMLCARWTLVAVLTGCLSAVSTLIFMLLASQPLLVLILTLGGCLFDGCDEWLDFTYDVFTISLIPLAIAILAGLTAMLASMIRRRYQSA